MKWHQVSVKVMVDRDGELTRRFQVNRPTDTLPLLADTVSGQEE
ncbi:MAG: hypothetical protein AAFV53_42065 [Myxococcota bacterium]